MNQELRDHALKEGFKWLFSPLNVLCAWCLFVGAIGVFFGFSPEVGVAIGVVSFFILGFIVLSFLFVKSSDIQEQESKEMNRLKRCPVCYRDLSANARVCPRCGHQF